MEKKISSKKDGVLARKLAVEILIKVERNQVFANLALSEAFKRKSISERDRAFVTCLVQGVTRHKKKLDNIISSISKEPLEKLSISLKVVLRVALFQLNYMKEIPASAVVNTATEVAKQVGHLGTAKYTNAVLRNYLQKLNTNSDIAIDTEIDLSIQITENATENVFNSISALSDKYSLPEWLVSRWLDYYGYDECLKLCQYSQSIPQLTIRVNESAISASAFAQILLNKNIKFEFGKLVSSCLNILDRGAYTGPITKLPGFSEGLFAVQDESAAFVSKVLDPKPGNFIIDLAAAPGGKSFHIADLMQGKGRILALDISPKRLALIAKERARQGFSNIETICADASNFKLDSLADAVLLDAPCTGTGVLNKRSDLRENKKENHINKLAHIQTEMFNNAAKLVKPGGVLVYSTCSMEEEEGYLQIVHFLKNNPEYQTETIYSYLEEELKNEWSKEEHWLKTEEHLKEGYIQLLPSRHKYSGFFLAKLRRQI